MNISKVAGFSGGCRYKSGHAPKFNGLWGKTSVIKIGRDEVLGVPIEGEEKYYFPFQDEKPEDVEKIIKDRQRAEILNKNGVTVYELDDCRLGLELPFSKEDFEKYYHLVTPVRNKFFETIHKLVKNKYTIEDAGSIQSVYSAYNPVMDRPIGIFAYA